MATSGLRGALTTELVARFPSNSVLAALTLELPTLALEGVLVHDHVLANAPATSREAIEARRDDLGLLHSSVRDGKATFFLPADRGERATLGKMRRSGLVPLSPLRWAKGALEVRLVCEQADAAARLMASGLNAELMSKRRRAPQASAGAGLAAEALMPSLTAKQARAVQAAIALGYYDQPRGATTAEIARSLRVSRSTLEDHLRRGEAQLIRSVGPLLGLHLPQAPADDHVSDALAVYAKFSSALGLYVELALRGDKLARVRLRRQRPAGAKPQHPYLSKILDHVTTGRGDLGSIPLDLEVTPFERDVLELMRRIPAGEVLTYGQLAERLGKPGAARAVGNVCAMNPVPLVIPCHRVVAGNGTIGNYSAEGGKVTKERLLRIEGALPAKEPVKEKPTRKRATEPA